MNEKTYRLPGAAAVSVPAADIDKLLSLGDGECALLYLHVVRSGGVLLPAMAARALSRTEAEIESIARRLDRAGLLSAEGPSAPLPGPEELPEYAPGEIARRADEAFAALRLDTAQVLGRDLSGGELQTLFGLYDHMAMPPEVIMLLIHHCADRLRARYGERRAPTMWAIQKEAHRWARMEIHTLEQAEEYLARMERQTEERERVRQALSLTDRALSESERKYLDDWLDKGFTARTLALAYDRTVVSTGKLSWAYMDSIVQSWYKKGLFTPEDIEKGDPRPTGKKKANRSEPAPAQGDDLDRLKRMLQDKR